MEEVYGFTAGLVVVAAASDDSLDVIAESMNGLDSDYSGPRGPTGHSCTSNHGAP
jgi:hypothetical protein